MRFRQVHLDFHTSEHIRKIGSRFDKKQFQKALQAGHVDSVTLFAKCHHGWSYHPTEVGQTHPHLGFDLLGSMIQACREIDVKTPVYLSAGFDEFYLREINPGHACVAREGNDPLQVGYRRLCFNTPYLGYLCRQIEEVAERYEAYGIFLDIVGLRPCYCQFCVNEMLERGMDPSNDADVLKLAREAQIRYFEASMESVRKIDGNMRLFQNAGHVHKGDRWFNDFVTHIELESLPTGGWGYDHFPLSARYAITQPHAFLGMTGKFHTSWGEFGGFKHDNALRYECAAMLANGARCSIGDQLHPNGRMNPDTYRKIGLAYAEMEAKETFCADAETQSEIAILSIEAIRPSSALDAHKADRNRGGDVGASRMLLERQIMFDVIDGEAELGKYRVIIVPDEGRMNQSLAKKLQRFVKQGGKLALSFESGMREDRDEFWFDVGQVEGFSPWEKEYIKPTRLLHELDADQRLLKEPTVIWGDAALLKPAEGAQILAQRHDPYFNRSLHRFCSHRHAPDSKKSSHPAIVHKGSVLYFAHAIFRHYADRGQMLYRDIFVCALRRLLEGDFNASASMPSCGRLSLMKQADHSRYVLHLLYATPIQRGGDVSRGDRWGPDTVQVIEDVVPLRKIRCRVRLPKRIKAARHALSGEPLEFSQERSSSDDEYEIAFTVAEMELHEIILLEY